MLPKKRELRRPGSSLGFVFLLALCAVVPQPGLANGEAKKTKDADTLRHFYIVGMATSDDIRYWFDYILDARPNNGDVRVRYIRIASEYPDCPGFVSVKAIEANLAGTRLNKLMGHADLCSIKETDVDAAIADARPKSFEGITESEKFGLVAQCGQTERVFSLPYPETVDMRALKAKRPDVASLYDLEGKISRRAFGKRNPFYDITPSEDLKLLQFGAMLVSLC